MTKIKWQVIYAVLGILTFAAFAGAVTGTLAWWAYSNQVAISFYGTSVEVSDMLQIGLKTDIDMTPEGMGETEVINGESYSFVEAGGALTSNMVSYYLEQQNVYAVNQLVPVTSASYAGNNEEMTLKGSIVAGTPYNANPAETERYVKLPLVFRVLQIDSIAGDTYAPKRHIWLSRAACEASSEEDGEVHKALRMYANGIVMNDDEDYVPTRFIVNPNSTENTLGYTNVGGLLNLSGGNQYYDYYTDNEDGLQYEMIYGEYTGTPSTVTYGADTELADINATGQTTPTTFLAKHKAGVKAYNDLSAIAPKRAVYETLGTVAPIDDNGSLSGGKPFCTTEDNTAALAHVDLTIWLEGWDHTVIDQENNHFFNLDLVFQIDSK